MADKMSKVILPVKSGDNIELKEFDIRDADIAASQAQAYRNEAQTAATYAADPR